MPIPAIPIVVGILASAGGLSLGALIRQPQINALKAQVTKLQEEFGRMQTLCNNVMKDIEILKLRMQMQQNEDLLTQLKGQEDLNIGQLVYAYGLKEYLEIKQSYLIEGKDITETEAVFADTFAMFLDNKIADDENGLIQKRFIRGYLLEKYAAEIDSLTPPDLSAVIATLEHKINEAKAQEEAKREQGIPNEVIPELECLSLNEEQTRFLYSLQLIKIEYDIKTAKNEKEKNAKTTWKNEWMNSILHALGKEKRTLNYFIKDAQSLFDQMRAAYDKSAQKTWYFLVAFEAALFVPYFPLDADKKSNKLWKHLSLNQDYMREEFHHHQMVVNKAMLDKMVKTYNRYINKLTGKTIKMVTTIVVTSVVTVATGGLASIFAPSIAVVLAGGSVAHLSGAALINASLAFVGGGSLVAGGLGMAGGTAIITGGGALLGMVGSGATAVSAMVLLSTEGYTLRECAKLISFSDTVLMDEFEMKSTVQMIQQTVQKRIGEFGAQLAILKATPKAEKKVIRSIETSMNYLEKCNKELHKLIGK